MPVSQYPTPKPPITWTYADAAARLAAIGFGGLDVGKFALQLSDATVWRLQDDAPIVWRQEPNGPVVNKFRNMKPEWPSALVKRMKDGGGVTSNSNPTPELKWELIYKKVGQAGSGQLALLDAHYLESEGVRGFEFRHPKTLALYSDVHYESFDDPDHGNRVYQQTRKVVLVKWPPA
jgi:hypothetical protein